MIMPNWLPRSKGSGVEQLFSEWSQVSWSRCFEDPMFISTTSGFQKAMPRGVSYERSGEQGKSYRSTQHFESPALRRLIEFYVTAHNEVMPHSAFQGQTPDEVFFGIDDEVTKRLSEASDSAREKRIEKKRATGCGVCVWETSSGALLLQRPRSRMS